MTASQNLLQQAILLFLQYGIKSVTMDDLARHLGVSKKTLYEHVENKSDLVNKTIMLHLETEKDGISDIMKLDQNPIDQMYELVKFGTRHIRQMNPALVYDLQKYYRSAWNNFLKFKKEYMYSCILQNLKNGIEMGYYREDIKPEIITLIYLFKIEALVDQTVFPVGDYTYKDIVEQYLKYHIWGISNEKGRKYLETKELPL